MSDLFSSGASGVTVTSDVPSFKRPHNFPIFEPQRTLRVICIGAGASGLYVAYKLQRHFDNVELEIFEKNPEVSGTWYENTYPGCACDVPSHCYTFSHSPKQDWSANYATSKEIFAYFNEFAQKNDLLKYVKVSHKVVGATWNEAKGEWTVKAEGPNGAVEKTCNVLINAGGILNAWRFPPIPGIETFKGKLVHSAGWDSSVQLEGKVVGLIGNGSSGIQILPAIKDKVGKLVTFIREATWVAPPLGEEFAVYTEEQKQKFKDDPQHHLQMRKETEMRMNGSFELFHPNSELQKQTRQYMEMVMKEKLSNPELEKVLVPEWSVGCRRITPGTNYLESLSDEKVHTVFGNITNITETGVVCDNGKEYPVEVLICATGFDTTFKPRFPLIGNNGQNLQVLWKDEPNAYLGLAAPEMPNYFMTLGPNCPIGNGPVLIAIEAQVDYIVQMLSKFQKQNIKSFEIRPEPTKAFNDWKDEFMKHSIWTEECRSWYKNGSAFGKVVALWPGSTMHYLEAIEQPRYEDWSYKYESTVNPFQCLGNGHSSAEKRVGGDLSYYIRNEDNSKVDIVLKNGSTKVFSQTKPSPEEAAKERFEPSSDPATARL